MANLPSGVQIKVDGVDRTRYAMPEGASFSSSSNAVPGQCQITFRDKEQELSFATGDMIELILDDVPLWTGFVTGFARTFLFPVVDTANRPPNQVKERAWKVRGVDLNVLFDKRVLRNTADYRHQLPNFDDQTYDGELIREALVDSKYFDIEDIYDVETEVDDVVRPFDPENEGTTGEGAWVQQGSTMRAFIEDLTQFSGAVYYFAPNKKLHYKALEDSVARWGFSDVPNNGTIDGSPGYQDVTIGFRDLDASEEGGPGTIVNDALIWGGSEWAGSGQTVFKRTQNATSITNHGRWQLAEVHFGEDGYKRQKGVDARANVIVNGAPGVVGGDANRGLRFPQTTITLTWFAHRVPKLAGAPDHLVAGQLVNIDLHTFGDGSALEYLLPLRNLEISFPSQSSDTTADDPKTWVEFRGTFGLQLSDPYTLWRYLLQQKNRADRPRAIATVDGSNNAPYGALLSVEPTPTPDGSETVFDLPDDRGYITGTTQVWVDGIFQRLGIEYDETDPDAGEITFDSPPGGGSWVWVICRVTGA